MDSDENNGNDNDQNYYSLNYCLPPNCVNANYPYVHQRYYYPPYSYGNGFFTYDVYNNQQFTANQIDIMFNRFPYMNINDFNSQPPQDTNQCNLNNVSLPMKFLNDSMENKNQQFPVININTNLSVCPSFNSPIENTQTQPKKTHSRARHPMSDVLKEWFMKNLNNPYPDPTEKFMLQKKTGMTSEQLKDWCANYRRSLRKNGKILPAKRSNHSKNADLSISCLKNILFENPY